jgi:acetolactate synthase-1/2/3 large subunit
VSSLAEFEDAFTRSLAEPGVTIIDVLVDYSRNTELFAELHDGVLE